MSLARVNGVQLFYEFHGPEDGELLILNNGVFMNTASWAFQMPDLSKRYRVLAYDMRGQGQSEHPEGPYSRSNSTARTSPRSWTTCTSAPRTWSGRPTAAS